MTRNSRLYNFAVTKYIVSTPFWTPNWRFQFHSMPSHRNLDAVKTASSKRFYTFWSLLRHDDIIWHALTMPNARYWPGLKLRG
jgi:hypothetical protein